MRRIMIIGQPGAGRSAFARELAGITHLPVFHDADIRRTPDGNRRNAAERDAYCAAVHAGQKWVFEGGHARSWPERLERADTVIWLDLPFHDRVRQLLRRMPGRSGGVAAPVTIAGLRHAWATRRSARADMQALFEAAPEDKSRYRLRSRSEARRFLNALRFAAKFGNLGISHR